MYSSLRMALNDARARGSDMRLQLYISVYIILRLLVYEASYQSYNLTHRHNLKLPHHHFIVAKALHHTEAYSSSSYESLKICNYL